MRIKQHVIEKIKANPLLQGKLCAEFKKKSMRTVERWLSENADNGILTSKAATLLISEELKLSEDQIMEDTATVAA